MNVMPFDQTFGDAWQYDPTGQYLRDVALLINGWWQSTALCTNCHSDGIKSTLNFKGWIIEQVVDQTTSWIPGLYGGATYRIDAIVARNYTDAQIEQQIIKDLAGFFNIIGVTFLTPPYAGLPSSASAPASDKKSAGTNYASPPVAIDPPGRSSTSNDFVKSFASSLGMSAPIAILGGAVLLALLLRR
jgi:hypothetical protein